MGNRVNVKELRELVASIPPGDDHLQLEFAEKHQALRDLNPGEYDSYEGTPTGNYIGCELYYQSGTRVEVSHW